MARYRAARRAPWWLRASGIEVKRLPQIDPDAGGPVPARVDRKEPA
jgi:hypothetical protein